jgi:uncharacterized membrane protein
VRVRLPWILLALSLALNIFFIGGAVWIKVTHHPPGMTLPQRVERISRELSLEPAQRTALEQFLRTVRQRGTRLRDANLPLIEEAWREMANPNPDTAVVDKAFAEVAENRRSFQQASLEALRGFLATLTPEQRTRFIELVRTRPKPGEQRLWPGVG